MTPDQASNVITALKVDGFSWHQIERIILTMDYASAISAKATDRLLSAMKHDYDMEKYGPRGPRFAD